MRRLLPSLLPLLVLLSPGAEAAVRGVVMTEEGRPLAGATITAYEAESPAVTTARWRTGVAEQDPLASTKSDAHGRFQLPFEETRALEIVVRAAGRVPRRVSAISTMDLGAIPLAAGKPLRGVAVASGTPLANAVIVVGGGEQVTTSGEDGSFELTVSGSTVPPVRVFHPEYAVLQLPSGPVSRLSKLQLTTGATVRGRVVDADERPVAGARVAIDSVPLAESEEDGSFTIRAVSATWSELTAIEGSRIGTGFNDRKKADYTLRLGPGASLTGSVRSSTTGAGEAGVTVTLAPTGPFRRSGTFTQVFTDAKGNFSLGPLAPGPYMFICESPLLISVPMEMSLEPGERASRTITLEAKASIVGTVLDENRQPVPAAQISLAPPPGRRMPRSPGFAWSAPDGTFVLLTAAADDILLEAARRGYPRGRGEPLRARAGETTRGARIVLPSGLEVSGSVADVHGTPIEGAELRFTEADADRMTIWLRQATRPGGIDPGSIQTDPKGRFTTRLAGGKYDLVVEREGYAPTRLTSLEVTPGLDPILVEMADGVSISGRVVSADGAGAGDVNVGVVEQGNSFRQPVQTAPDGSFVISDLPRGPVRLMVSSVEHQYREPRVVEAPSTGIVIEMPATGSVRGRVIDKATRRPITAFEVGTSGRQPGVGSRPGFPNISPVQNDEGTFELENVPAGMVELVAQASGYVAGHSAAIEVEAGEVTEGVEIELEQGARITGTVLGPDGAPIMGASVFAQPAGVSSFMQRNSARTDADGRYELDGVAEGELELRASHESLVPDRRTVRVSGRSLQVDFRLGRGVEVEGTVVTSTGMPVEGAEVNAFSSAVNSMSASARTDAGGRFLMKGLGEGRYTFRASKAGMAGASVDDVAIGSGIPVRIEMRSGGSIRGRVTGLQPSEYASVEVSASGAGSGGQSGVSPDGSFAIEGVAAGPTRVWAQLSSVSGTRATPQKVVEVTEGATATVDFEFGSGHTVRGRVTRNGVPADGVTVFFRPVDRTLPTGTSRSDANGNYEVNGLGDGDYTVRAHDSRSLPSFTEKLRVTGLTRFDIDLRAARIEGRVVHAATHEPIGGAQVTLQRIEENQQPGGTIRVQSDSSGRFFFDGASPGRFVLRAEKHGFGQEVQDLQVSDSPISGLELRLSPSEGLRLRVVDARDGRSLDGWVSIGDAAGRTAYQGPLRAGAGGLAQLPLAAGSYSGVVNASGYAPQPIRFTVPGAILTVSMRPGATLRIESSASSIIRGRLVDPTGQAAPLGSWMQGAVMEIRPGVSEFSNAPAGPYVLEILDETGSVVDRKQVTLTEGETAVVRL